VFDIYQSITHKQKITQTCNQDFWNSDIIKNKTFNGAQVSSFDVLLPTYDGLNTGV